MFAKSIILSDAFLDMPASTRCLYMTLSMLADDDGFINSPRSIMRQSGATDDDMRILLAKKFVIAFDDGVVVIKHWRIHNYIQNDRYQATKYIEHKNALVLDENKAYKLAAPAENALVSIPYTQDRIELGKDRIELGKDINNEKRPRFAPPTLDEMKAYIDEAQLDIDAAAFIDYYEANGWKVGKSSMKDWKATARNWSRRDKAQRGASCASSSKSYKQPTGFSGCGYEPPAEPHDALEELFAASVAKTKKEMEK